MKLTYNSTRPDLIIPEYGRSIHRMVAHCVSISDREERNRCARAIIKIMGNLFPQLRDVEVYNHKLWDQLHVMSDFKLDVDSPYPVPTKESFETKPKRMGYPKNNIKYGHYGRTIEKVVKEAAKIEDPEERQKAAVSVANLMKRTYVVWAQNSVKDEVIANDLKKLSDGVLVLENPEKELDDTRDVVRQMGIDQAQKSQNKGRSRKKTGGRKRKKKY